MDPEAGAGQLCRKLPALAADLPSPDEVGFAKAGVPSAKQAYHSVLSLDGRVLHILLIILCARSVS